MAQYDLNLRDYYRILRKRRKIVIGVPLIFAAFAFLLTPTPRPKYEATAKIRVSRGGVTSSLFLETFYYWEEGSYLTTQSEIITSQDLLVQVAKEVGLIPEEATFRDILNSQEYVGTVEAIKERVSAKPIEQTSIIEIVAAGPAEDEAIKLVNTVAEVYREYNTYQRNRQTIESRRFIEDQLADYERALGSAEDSLAEFVKQHPGVASLDGAEVGETQKELQRVASQIAQLRVQIGQIDRQLQEAAPGGVEFSPIVDIPSPRLQNLRAQLGELKANRDQLLLYQSLDSPQIQDLNRQVRRLAEAIRDEYQTLIRDLEQQRRGLVAQFQSLPETSLELARLQREVKVNEEVYSLLKKKHQEALIKESEQLQEVSIVEKATFARQATESGKLAKALIGLFVGLMVGVVVALIRETLDTSIGAIEDVESFLELPVMGVIPPINREKNLEILREKDPDLAEHRVAVHFATLVTHVDTKSPVAEAYRSLRTNLERMREERAGKAFVVTSSTLEEGKSTTAANLAVVMAQLGKRTLLVSGDLRRPFIHKIFGVEKAPGFAEVIAGSINWRAAVFEFSDLLVGELSLTALAMNPGLDNLYLMPSGETPGNPAELLSSPNLRRLLDEVRDDYDVVIIDAPPVVPVTDAAVIGREADGVLLVYEVGKIGRGVLRRAKSQLEMSRVELWGVVLNDIKAEVQTFRDSQYYYQYYYRYGYGNLEERRRLSRLRDTAQRWLAAFSEAVKRAGDVLTINGRRLTVGRRRPEPLEAREEVRREAVPTRAARPPREAQEQIEGTREEERGVKRGGLGTKFLDELRDEEEGSGKRSQREDEEGDKGGPGGLGSKFLDDLKDSDLDLL